MTDYHPERRDCSFETIPLSYRLKTFACNVVIIAYEKVSKFVRKTIARAGKQDCLDNKLISK